MIRLLCVGVGGMGRTDWTAASEVEEFQIVSGVDPNSDAREYFEKQTGCPTFDSIPEALDNVPADAAIVATPDKFHAPFSIQLMEAGLDVICEKPMAKTPEDARRMHAVAERLGRMLMIHCQMRYHPSLNDARRMIEEGAIGKIRSVDLDMQVFSPSSLSGYRSRESQLILRDLGIHHFDLLRFLTGKECESIYVSSWKSTEDDLPVPATTDVCAILNMTGPVTVSYRAQTRSLMKYTTYRGRTDISGSRGVMTVSDKEIQVQTYEAKAREEPPRTMVPGGPGYTAMGAFAEAIRTRQPALTWSGDNMKSLAVMFAAIESAETGAVARPASIT